LTGEVLILGGYGNFGKRIARALSRHGVPVIVAGRDLAKARTLAAELPQTRAVAVDIHGDFAGVLARERPVVVVHTCGPFQGADYSVARACAGAGVHYVDLADGRDFVRDFGPALDAEAKAAGVVLVSGASTVPGLSSAVLTHYAPHFQRLDGVDFGISPGQKAERGLATTRAIMSYVGRPLRPFAGHAKPYGWQDLHSQVYPVMGRRWLAACDIPDLDLLPQAFGLRDIRFGAGLELGFMHFGVWALSWLVRWGLPLPLVDWAGPLLKVSDGFNGMGSDVGGMHVTMSGIGADGQPLRLTWFIVAEKGDGPQIPCVPAILLAKWLAQGAVSLAPGAGPCVGLVRLEDYVGELERFAVRTYDSRKAAGGRLPHGYQPPRKSALPSGTPE